MPENGENTTLLVSLAAEGMAEVVKGCAQTINGGRSNGAISVDTVPPKAINVFGPRIVEHWLRGLNTRPQTEQLDAIAALGTLPVPESRRQATAAIERVAATASAEDKSTAVEYLTVIPMSVRRALVHDPDTGKMALPTQFMKDDGIALIRLLPTDVPPFAVGSEVPGTTYILEELLGLGGFGAVYKAKNRCEQHQPPRAIKFCLDASMVATLSREREILDRLMAVDTSKWSTRIVRLYGYALESKPPFLVYEYVPGGDLTTNIRVAREKTGRGFRPTLALELIRQVTEALAFAHAHGLVHRDLKPANVLVSGSKIKLTDFGIGGVMATHAARGGATHGGGSVGAHGTAADQATLFRGSGTPLYMSPEQRRGDQPDPRHDLYSLGVMWYQLIVGDVSKELHPGWQDELVEEYQVPQEHIDLIAKCVGYFKKRPLNAGELVAMLPPPGGGSKTSTDVNKEDGLASAGDEEFHRLKDLLADQLERDALNEARETVAAILQLNPGDVEAVESRAFIEERLGAGGIVEVHAYREHKGWVRAVAVGPDGRTALSGGDDQAVVIWDLLTRKPLKALLGHEAAVSSVVYSPDGSKALSGSFDGTARVWDLTSGKEIQRISGAWKVVQCVAFSPEGERLVFGADDHLLHFHDVGTGEELGTLAGHTDLVRAVAFSPDGRRAVSGGDDNTVRIWDLDAAAEFKCLQGHGDSVTSVAFAPNGKWVLSGSSDNSARLWDVSTGKELRRFAGHSNWVNGVGFSTRALQIVTCSGGEINEGKFDHGSDLTVRIWDLQSAKELIRFAGHTASVTAVVFAPDGKQLVSGGLDKTVRLLQLPG
jgi:WD40 repeat protein